MIVSALPNVPARNCQMKTLYSDCIGDVRTRFYKGQIVPIGVASVDMFALLSKVTNVTLCHVCGAQRIPRLFKFSCPTKLPFTSAKVLVVPQVACKLYINILGLLRLVFD